MQVLWQGARGVIGAFFLLGLLWGWPVRALASPVSMQVTDADVRAVLLSAARLGGINLVLDGSVTGTVSVALTAEPAEVLRQVAAAHSLVLVPAGEGTYLVTAAGETGQLRQVYVWPVHYAEPHELAAAINLSLGGQEKGTGVTNVNKIGKNAHASKGVAPAAESRAHPAYEHVLVDEATNSLLYYGTAAEAAQAERLARQLDVPAQQVELSAQVVALTKSGSRAIGTELSGETADTITFTHDPEGGPLRGTFAVKLHELITHGQAKILARPKVTTIQGHEARINIGGEVPVPRQTSTYRESTTTYEYHQVGITLQCTPRVNADGRITTDVFTEVSSPEYVPELKAYRFQERSATTRVRLHDNETMVIGGLIGQEESRTLSRIPFLSQLPILGSFFTYVHNSHEESEIMIFLQAHVLPEAAPAAGQ